MEACEWWSAYGSVAPKLKQLAMKVLSRPASASASEQSWSEYDYIHSKRRHRLKADVASKLVFVHSNLRLLRTSRDCARYTDLLKLSAQQAHEQQLIMQSHLLTEGWDGDCSDADDDACTCDTAVADITPLDTTSFLNPDAMEDRS